MATVWDQYLDERDSEVYSKAGFGRQNGIGQKPALVIVDVTYGFAGDEEEPVEESIKKYPTSCGATSWESIPYIKKLLTLSREVEIPVFYTVIEGSKRTSNHNVAVKGDIFNHPQLMEGSTGSQIVEDLAPINGEEVISKKKPSAFFGTPLESYLTAEKVDSVIVTGCTTSGCIRATVIDAFSYNYQVIVPEECVFDRGITSHAINLFDMQQKYADVYKTEDVIEQLNKIEGGLQ
ncbi:isochorismatase family protein [Salicibibacter cibarius]|uniref:Isochorismatase family protein n=1 Tax=Salicibibacter cibarius TaxID=2743000 RepID=A0A7T6Z0Q2_9BACI|nr:isochorismatase family protein [Salicibibacter cibarius]QQK74707.1 isochorismatase family protein [Salicibibacter cibarius]